MEHRDWDENYRSGETPWDTGRPEPLFVEALSASVLPEGRALEIGCGTGVNARLFAEAGYDVVAVDLSPTAIEPVLELVTLRSVAFAEVESGPAAWWCLARRSEVPAQPSTHR